MALSWPRVTVPLTCPLLPAAQSMATLPEGSPRRQVGSGGVVKHLQAGGRDRQPSVATVAGACSPMAALPNGSADSARGIGNVSTGLREALFGRTSPLDGLKNVDRTRLHLGIRLSATPARKILVG